MTRAWVRLIIAALIAHALAAGLVLACGPDGGPLPTVAANDPADWDAFERGEIGVIRPRFTRTTMAMAYRVLNAQPPLRIDDSSVDMPVVPSDSAWRVASDPIVALPAAGDRTKRVIDYVTPLNCLQGAYDTAVRTLGERQSRYGAGSEALRDWVRALQAVFANCDETPLLLPEPAPANADALTRADRAYQTAAAYFYAMQYDEAARRFTAIAADTSSPWRPYGRYLAGRARIRAVTMATEALSEEAVVAGYDAAEKELQAAVADPIAAPVHASARGLIRFVRLRAHRGEERIALAREISTQDEVPWRTLDDFSYAMRGLTSDSDELHYEFMTDELRGAPDLVDWIAAMKGNATGAGRDHAIARWRETKSIPWLTASLTHLAGPHEAADALLGAAAAVPVTSPAFATISFLRIRLLIALDRAAEARRALAGVPDVAGPGVLQETINLYRGERFQVAATLEELLKASPRISLAGHTEMGSEYKPIISFDEDAAAVFNERLPLQRLVDACLSTTLPDRLRARVAAAAFTRAILLNRHDAARRVAPALRSLAPQLAADLDRYLGEKTADAQRRAALLLILRTPGMTKNVMGLDDLYSVDFVEPRRTFENFVAVWWCAPIATTPPRQAGQAASELIHTLYPTHVVPYPSFVTEQERATVDQELASLNAIGQASRYLAVAALDWAQQRPKDPDAAEALSRVVNGWRRACRDASDVELARRSFQTLHRLFPDSEWAAQTKYWYR